MAPPNQARKRTKTAREKLEFDHPSHGKPFVIPSAMEKSLGAGTMIVPRPLDVEALMRMPRRGRLVTIGQIRGTLADRAGVNKCCPLTTGIFVRLVAEAAEEDAENAGLRPRRERTKEKANATDKTPPAKSPGETVITPWWRTIRDDGKLIDKFPGGSKAQAAQLRSEGFTIQPGEGQQPPRVTEFEKKLVRLKAG